MFNKSSLFLLLVVGILISIGRPAPGAVSNDHVIQFAKESDNLLSFSADFKEIAAKSLRASRVNIAWSRTVFPQSRY